MIIYCILPYSINGVLANKITNLYVEGIVVSLSKKSISLKLDGKPFSFKSIPSETLCRVKYLKEKIYFEYNYTPSVIYNLLVGGQFKNVSKHLKPPITNDMYYTFRNWIINNEIKKVLQKELKNKKLPRKIKKKLLGTKKSKITDNLIKYKGKNYFKKSSLIVQNCKIHELDN